jgi:hypothetical protein
MLDVLLLCAAVALPFLLGLAFVVRGNVLDARRRKAREAAADARYAETLHGMTLEMRIPPPAELEETYAIVIDPHLGTLATPKVNDEGTPIFQATVLERLAFLRPFDLPTAVGPGWILPGVPRRSTDEDPELVGAR